MITLKWYNFSELQPDLLYSILALRSTVFVVEQKRVCLDPDGKDPLAMHLVGVENGVLVAYARLFPPTETQSDITFGRVLTASSVRNKGYGKLLVMEIFRYSDVQFHQAPVMCCAQQYLQKFYENFGMRAHGGVFELDGISHVFMKK